MVIVAVLYAWNRDILSQPSARDVVGILSDCFFLPGALLSGIAGLSWIASKGTFDILSYGTSYMIGHFLPGDNVFRTRQTFYDYKRQKDEKGRSWLNVGLWCGLLSIFLGVLFWIVYTVM